MNLIQRAIVGVVIVCGVIFFQITSSSQKNDLINQDTQLIINKAKQSFVKAEKVVFGGDDGPIDPDTPSGPNPDPNKCACKGTGEIVQGDGHISLCPYHAKPEPKQDTCDCGCGKTECGCQGSGECLESDCEDVKHKRIRPFRLFRSRLLRSK